MTPKSAFLPNVPVAPPESGVCRHFGVIPRQHACKRVPPSSHASERHLPGSEVNPRLLFAPRDTSSVRISKLYICPPSTPLHSVHVTLSAFRFTVKEDGEIPVVGK